MIVLLSKEAAMELIVCSGVVIAALLGIEAVDYLQPAFPRPAARPGVPTKLASRESA
jgi:hypothetical protein